MKINLIMTKKFMCESERIVIANQFGKTLSRYDYDGLSIQEIKENLSKERNTVIVTADSRFLDINFFDIDSIYLYREGEIKPIRECTARKLRVGHNLYKLYNSGEFE